MAKVIPLDRYTMVDAKLIGPDVSIPHLVSTFTIWLVGLGLAARYDRARS